jgi:hypothetical protein
MAMFMLIGNKKRELQRRQEYLNDFQTLFREVKKKNNNKRKNYKFD